MMAPATDLETPASQAEAAQLFEGTSENDLEKLFTEKGFEGLQTLASAETQTLLGQFDALSTPEPEAATFAPAESAELTEAAGKAKQDLQTALQSFEASGKPVAETMEVSQEVLEPTEEEEAEPVPLVKLKPVESTPAPQEEIEASAEEALSEKFDWKELKEEEASKLETAKADYEQVNQTLQAFKDAHQGAMTPIEKKYLNALETQIEMDYISLQHAENQIDLYAVNEKIEILSHDENMEGSQVDALIEQRNVKDALSKEFAEEFLAAETAHDTALADYMKAYEGLRTAPGASAKEKGTSPEEEKASSNAEQIKTAGASSKEVPSADKKKFKPKKVEKLLNAFGGSGTGEAKETASKKQKPGLAKRLFGSWWNWVKK
ncbi:hypothetical protein COX00_02580 [Candidatus Uhrbacteria bacterium CG22_combo_CG10-13_8_21_14_all_47_17]|uniref:Uncharacterized protein n=1 Tax=Candidatus Uhrbacteria bacterium CG22_combo_CG10-13_8_21_14_all_47_17 TaxID=1975041 RepID=A0A2H0BU59_9BACT|nr:MAG: hypothetical protein COX00_02580 [Candidatus Uhrbacteria bacterium CG22_combo_CG10-13_8_21_14_all_47_17]